MKILMLGWEYPPHISGGLGTACEGLTTALASRGIEIDFLVPKLFGEEDAPHMQLLGAASAAHTATQAPAPAQRPAGLPARLSRLLAAEPSLATDPIFIAAAQAARAGTPLPGPADVNMIRVPAMLKPYLDQKTYQELIRTGALRESAIPDILASRIGHPLPDPPTGSSSTFTFPAWTCPLAKSNRPERTTGMTSSQRSPDTPCLQRAGSRDGSTT